MSYKSKKDMHCHGHFMTISLVEIIESTKLKTLDKVLIDIMEILNEQNISENIICMFTMKIVIKKKLSKKGYYISEGSHKSAQKLSFI